MNLINNYNINRTLFTNDTNKKIFINSFINHIYVINLETDKLRRNYIIKLMEKYQINFELIIVPKLQHSQYEIIGNTKISIGEAGCYLSHMFCLHDSIINNYDNIIIFEDDIILHKDFHNIFEKYMTENIFDIFMLGASDFSFRRLNSILLDIQKCIYMPDINTKFLCGTYAIFYSKAGYNNVFNTRLDNPTFMDDNLIQFLDIFRQSFYISYPSLVAVDVSNTNIEHNFWVTNPLRDKYYYNNCFNNEFDFLKYNFINLKLLDNCLVKNDLSYEDNILETINQFFQNDAKQKDAIGYRLEYNFFTTDDLLFIINGK